MKQAAATVAVPLMLTRLSLAAPASGLLQHAAIGVGGQGAYDLDCINKSGKVKVYALCDIDELTLKKAAALYPDARLYRDWREMLEKEEGNIDSVNVSTPDHMHAPAAMTAIGAPRKNMAWRRKWASRFILTTITAPRCSGCAKGPSAR